MTNETLRKFIFSFCSDNEFRDTLVKPNYYDNGYIAASDSTALVFTHAPDFDKTDCLDSKLGIWNIVEPFSKFYEKKGNPIGILDFSQIKTVLSNISMLPEYKDKFKQCSECGGWGNIECDCCGQDRPCEECEGEGEIKVGKEETGYYKYPDDQYFMIDGKPFGITAMGKLSERLSLIDAHELEVFENIKLDRIFFRIKGTDIYILQMGIYNDGDEIAEKTKHIIEVIKTN